MQQAVDSWGKNDNGKPWDRIMIMEWVNIQCSSASGS